MSMILKLSTGEDSTLGNYRKYAAALFGEISPAVEYLELKIRQSLKAADEPVLADESQVIAMLNTLHSGGSILSD